MHLGRGEDVRSRAGGGGEAEEAAAVAGTASFAAIAVDGGLKLARGAQALSLALVGVEVLHVPVEGRGERVQFNTECNDTACGSILERGFTLRQKSPEWVYCLFMKGPH